MVSSKEYNGRIWSISRTADRRFHAKALQPAPIIFSHFGENNVIYPSQSERSGYEDGDRGYPTISSVLSPRRRSAADCRHPSLRSQSFPDLLLIAVRSPSRTTNP